MYPPALAMHGNAAGIHSQLTRAGVKVAQVPPAGGPKGLQDQPHTGASIGQLGCKTAATNGGRCAGPGR